MAKAEQSFCFHFQKKEYLLPISQMDHPRLLFALFDSIEPFFCNNQAGGLLKAESWWVFNCPEWEFKAN